MKNLKFIALTALCFLAIFNSYGQSDKITFNVIGGLVNQSNLSERGNPNQFGGYIGSSAFKNLSKAKLNLELQVVYLNRTEPETVLVNNYKNFSVKGQLNYLIKTFPLADDFIYLGPGVAIHQPLNGNGDYNGPSFGANFKAMIPVKISKFPFFVTYDFDYITIQGFMRNGIGLSFSPNF